MQVSSLFKRFHSVLHFISFSIYKIACIYIAHKLTDEFYKYLDRFFQQ